MNSKQYQSMRPKLRAAYQIAIDYEAGRATAKQVVAAAKEWKAEMGDTKPLAPDLADVIKEIKTSINLVSRFNDVMGKFENLAKQARG